MPKPNDYFFGICLFIYTTKLFFSLERILSSAQGYIVNDIRNDRNFSSANAANVFSYARILHFTLRMQGE